MTQESTPQARPAASITDLASRVADLSRSQEEMDLALAATKRDLEDSSPYHDAASTRKEADKLLREYFDATNKADAASKAKVKATRAERALAAALLRLSPTPPSLPSNTKSNPKRAHNSFPTAHSYIAHLLAPTNEIVEKRSPGHLSRTRLVLKGSSLLSSPPRERYAALEAEFSRFTEQVLSCTDPDLDQLLANLTYALVQAAARAKICAVLVTALEEKSTSESPSTPSSSSSSKAPLLEEALTGLKDAEACFASVSTCVPTLVTLSRPRPLGPRKQDSVCH